MPPSARGLKEKKEEKGDSKEERKEEEAKEEEERGTETESQDDTLQKLVYDYLVSLNCSSAAKAFVKEIGSDLSAKPALQEDLQRVYGNYLNMKEGQLRMIGEDGVVSFYDIDGNGERKKKKRIRRDVSETGGDLSMTSMKEESQKQYTFGWKRYTEYCSIHGLDPMIGDKSNADTQILEFARYLMSNPAKSVKSAVANSYVSAVGKKLLEANVITAMRDIRTPELKELFSEAARQASIATAAAAAASVPPAAQNVTTVSVAKTVLETPEPDAKKKKRLREV